MWKKIFQKQLHKSGKSYQLDPAIPDGLVRRFLLSRIKMLLRGYLVLGKKIYLGHGCKISNKNNILIGDNVTIKDHVKIDGFASERLQIGHGSSIGSFSWISCTSHMSKYGKGFTMGNNSACGQFTEFGASGGIEIGNDVIMGSYVSFHSENHIFSDPAKLIREQGVTNEGIKIGNNVWIGAKATFLDGSVVGNNCVVAAGAVVKGIFPDSCVIGGVPAKILKTIPGSN